MLHGPSPEMRVQSIGLIKRFLLFYPNPVSKSRDTISLFLIFFLALINLSAYPLPHLSGRPCEYRGNTAGTPPEDRENTVRIPSEHRQKTVGTWLEYFGSCSNSPLIILELYYKRRSAGQDGGYGNWILRPCKIVG
jgi:hypothetical protein